MARIYNDVPQMWKCIRLFFFNGSMDLNLANLRVDLYGKDLQSCTTDVETFKLFFSNGLMACLAIKSVFISILSGNTTLMTRTTRNCKVCTTYVETPNS